MGRIRSLKPEFPLSETMGRVTRPARLLFVLLWTQCDDEGRARAAPILLRGTLFPYDQDVTVNDVSEWLIELAREGAIRLYTVGSDRYLEVVNWRKHQRIDRPTPSKIPGPFDDVSVLLDESSTSPRRVLDAGLDRKGEERRGEESEGSARGGEAIPDAPAKSSSKGRSPEARGTRIPEDFRFTPELVQLCVSLSLSASDVEERFRDYWRGVPGAKGRKLDWIATARNWIKSEADRKGGRSNGRKTRFEQVYGSASGR